MTWKHVFLSLLVVTLSLFDVVPAVKSNQKLRKVLLRELQYFVNANIFFTGKKIVILFYKSLCAVQSNI